MNNQEEKDSKFKKLLEQLELESWQLELLISGLSIYGVFSTKVYFDEWSTIIINEYNNFGQLPFLTTFILSKALTIILINLVIHVTLRGIWIGAIGLRYVSEEIEYDSMDYAPIFDSYFRRKVGSFDKYIENLEKYCSIIFAYTFLIFLMMFSLILYISEMVFVVYLLKYLKMGDHIISLIIVIFLFLGAIVLVDLLTLGSLRKIKEKSVSSLYFWLYRLISFMTFSFIYRPLILNFFDNQFTRRLFYFSIPYIFIVLFTGLFIKHNSWPYMPYKSDMVSTGHMIDNRYYDDLRIAQSSTFGTSKSNLMIKDISLEKFEVDESTLSIFLPLSKSTNKISEHNNFEKFVEEGLHLGIKSGYNDPKSVKQLEEQLSNILVPKFRKIRELRKSNIHKDSIDIITKEIDSIRITFEDKTQDAYKKAHQSALANHIESFKLYIDDRQVSPTNYYFQNHGYFNQAGIRIFLPLDSISYGMHSLKYEKIRISSNNSKNKVIFTLPFMYKD